MRELYNYFEWEKPFIWSKKRTSKSRVQIRWNSAIIKYIAWFRLYLQSFVFATQISANWICFEADEKFSLVTTNRQIAQLLRLFFPGFQFSSSLSLFSFSFVLLLLFFFFFYRVALSTRGSTYYISSFFTGSVFGKTSGIICWKSMNEVILLTTVFKPGTKTVWLLVNGLSLYYILIINLNWLFSHWKNNPAGFGGL